MFILIVLWGHGLGSAPQKHPAAAAHALTLAEVLVGAGGCRLRMSWVGEVQNRSHEASCDAGHETLSSVHEAVPLASISNAGVELCGTAPLCRGLAGAALSLWDLQCPVGRVFSVRAQRVLCWLLTPSALCPYQN